MEPTRRSVTLVSNGGEGPVLSRATITRDAPAEVATALEWSWGEARRALEGGDHTHWNWENKKGSILAGRHRLITLEADGEFQGVMAILAEPRPAKAHATLPSSVLYADFVEAAPWNLKTPQQVPRYFGVGQLLIAEAVSISMAEGLFGRVGLHSMPKAETFYRDRCEMTDFGEDFAYYDLRYFEYNAEQAARFLERVGLS